MSSKNVFPVVNLKNPLVIFQFLLFIVVSAMMINSLTYSDNVVMSLALVLFALAGPLFIVHKITSKLTIHSDHITTGSAFYRKKIILENVLSVKIYQQKGRFSGDFIHEDQATRFNSIYLSLKNSRRSEIIFPYNKELYIALIEAVNK